MRVSTRGYVVALVALTLVPFVVAGYAESRDIEERRQQTAERETRFLVELAIADQATLIEGAAQVLQLLARQPAVVSGTPAECDQVMADLHADNPRYSAFLASRLDGTVWCSSTPFNTTINLTDRTFFQGAVQSRAFAVGNYVIGRVTQRAILGVGHPVLDSEGQVIGVVSTGLDLSYLTDRLAASALPSGGILTVVDSGGVVLARSPVAAGFVGQRLLGNGTVVDEMLRHGKGTTVALGVDGVERFYAYDNLLGRTNGTVLVAAGYPTSAISGLAREAFLDRLLVVIGVAIAALALAWAGVESFVARPLRRLETAAQRIGQGDLSARAGIASGPVDLRVLGSQFDAMAASIERLDRAKQDFINNSAHELSTPLTPVKVQSQIVLQRAKTLADEPLTKAGQSLVRNVDRLAATVQGVVRVAELQANRGTQRLEAVDLAAAVREACAARRQGFEAKGVALEVESPSSLAARFDPWALQPAIGHLLENALRHTPAGSKVKVVLEQRREGPRLSVRDQGAGFDPAKAARLFLPFSRIHDNEETQGGLGLGLFFVRDAVERGGGKVFASSAGPGQGAEIGFQLHPLGA